MTLDHRNDFPVERALWGAGGLALIVVGVIGATALMLRYWNLPAGGPPAVPVSPLRISGAALQTAPQPEHVRYLAAQQQILRSTAWVDAQAGIARIPLDEAMALIADGKIVLRQRATMPAASASGSDMSSAPGRPDEAPNMGGTR